MPAIIVAGALFACTPTLVCDGDGPMFCAEGPRVRVAGIAARERDNTSAAQAIHAPPPPAIRRCGPWSRSLEVRAARSGWAAQAMIMFGSAQLWCWVRAGRNKPQAKRDTPCDKRSSSAATRSCVITALGWRSTRPGMPLAGLPTM